MCHRAAHRSHSVASRQFSLAAKYRSFRAFPIQRNCISHFLTDLSEAFIRITWRALEDNLSGKEKMKCSNNCPSIAAGSAWIVDTIGNVAQLTCRSALNKSSPTLGGQSRRHLRRSNLHRSCNYESGQFCLAAQKCCYQKGLQATIQQAAMWFMQNSVRAIAVGY